MNQAKRLAIFDRLAKAIPEPTTELVYDTAFELLVAVVLSAQATDVSVNKATAKLFPIANTPEKILALGIDGLKPYIKTIGLYNSKAEHIITLCRQLLESHAGQVPDTREALEKIHATDGPLHAWLTVADEFAVQPAPGWVTVTL